MRDYMKVLLIGLMLALFNVASGNTQTVSITATNDGYIRNTGVTYQDYRDLATASSAFVGSDGTPWRVGQSAGFVRVERAFTAFPIPSLASADACTLFVWGAVDASTVNFGIYIHSARAYKSVVTTADAQNFSGFRAGTTHNGAILNNTWNSSSYAAAYCPIVFNAAGLDSIEACIGDTLWVALISKEDYDNSAPADEEYVQFKSSGDATPGNRPYISLTYTPAGWSGTIGNLTNPAAVGAYSKSEIKDIR